MGNIFENTINPFNPKWYQNEFDQYISTGNYIDNQNRIIENGYIIPDIDGSKSSIFRNDSVLNNSFNEKQLIESLKDIYFNSSHKLIASNHDNVNFFQWNGNMSDMKLIPNTLLCEFSIPWNRFIDSTSRDKFKLSQYYRKWIKIEDILNNWNIFKFHIMIFINQRIYSEYEFRMDDQEVRIRFKYNPIWIQNNSTIYIYKFETNSQCRILISRELCKNQWNWKIPTTYLPDNRILNSKNILCTINKISDNAIRHDGRTDIDVLGDNLEFLNIDNGYIDISNISKFNKRLIESESKEWLWLSIVVPKFFHEYPGLLPTDVIYRPYEPQLQPVVTVQNNFIQHVKSSDIQNQKQVYVDAKGKFFNEYDGWNQMIRPMVLADAFENPFKEPYDDFVEDLTNLRDITVKAADDVESFRFFIKSEFTQSQFDKYFNNVIDSIEIVRNVYNTFLAKKMIKLDTEFENIYSSQYTVMINEIKSIDIESEYLHSHSTSDKNFWNIVSPLIYIPREFCDKYYVIHIIHDMGSRRYLWDNPNDYIGKVRYQRPIDISDIWTFEYNQNDGIWRPYPMNVEYKFPDVYLLTDDNENTPSLNRIFKSFFFYSDTMNVLNESRDIEDPPIAWDDSIEKYYYDQRAVYRDLFIEKFYWMGLQSIYKGMMVTNSRWELLEYVIDNESYQRFNDLFLHTMDPYFKMGMATYLKSNNFEFPFDDAINKLKESINLDWESYKRISNFEIYLNNSWVPSYFDYIIKIMDDFDYSNKLLKRPSSTFDIRRLLPLLIDIESDIYDTSNEILEDIKWILTQLNTEDYNLNISLIEKFKSEISNIVNNMKSMLEFTSDLDLSIYSIDDINHIISLINNHIKMINNLSKILVMVNDDISKNNIYEEKYQLINQINEYVSQLPYHIDTLSNIIKLFDIENFMKSINDLNSYFRWDKWNPGDNSLLAQVNQFDDPWSEKVKTARNKIFTSTSKLYALYQIDKTYTEDEVEEFFNLVSDVNEDILNFKNIINEFWEEKQLPEDEVVLYKLNYAYQLFFTFLSNMDDYQTARIDMMIIVDSIKNIFNSFDQSLLSDTEISYKNSIFKSLDDMILDLSHLGSNNNREDAYKKLDDIKSILVEYLNYLNHEQIIFEKLIEIFTPPIEFIDTLEKYIPILNTISEYMDTVNTPFIPDTSYPTYADIYEVEDIEIDTSGFGHELNDIAFAPKLGIYTISSIDNDIIKGITDSGYRKTVYRDPLTQNRSYDTITTGSGVGLTIKPLSSIHYRIINDEVISSIIKRFNNVTHVISNCILTPNSYNNIKLSNILNEINLIQNDWNNIKFKLESYMTSDIIENTDDCMIQLLDIISPCNDFINIRSGINITLLLSEFESLIDEVYRFTKENDLQDEKFHYYDDQVRMTFNRFSSFIGSGTSWDDINQLSELIQDTDSAVRLYENNIFKNTDMTSDNIIQHMNDIYKLIWNIKSSISYLPSSIPHIERVLSNMEILLNKYPNVLYKEMWYRIKNISPAAWGDNYQIGDIVEIIPELPTDVHGNQIHDQEDIIMNDKIFIQVIDVDNGRVTKLSPLMDYAIPYLIWGIRNVISRTGIGTGLSIDIFSDEIRLSDNTLLNDENIYISKIDPFDKNDMFKFIFPNVHDLEMNYEIFIGGTQINTFHQRSEDTGNIYHPQKNDVLYINANQVMNLQNASIYIPEEHYFIYKIDNINIIDPGAGYCIGQDIFVNTDQFALRLKVAKILYEPYKGIDLLTVSDGKYVYHGENPQGINSSVVYDKLNNIDDEYSMGWYDHIPFDGTELPITLSYNDTYTFKRYDDLDIDDRNSVYMYPDVNMPDVEDAATDGDPDGHWYQGNRIDNSQIPVSDDRRWNSIMNTISPTDPFIPDVLRIPTDKPVKGEYQLIEEIRLHNNDIEIEADLIVNTFADLPKHVNDWSDGKVGSRIIVEIDETSDNHRMLYTIRTFVATGYFVYNIPTYADTKWNSIIVDWMNCDYYPDYPSLNSQYPSAPWNESKTFLNIQQSISDGKYKREVIPKENHTTYIHDLNMNDISLFNWTTKEWENLNDTSRWELNVIDDPVNQKWGFILTFLSNEYYSYDMKLYLNKIPSSQQKNALLKRNAIMDISTSIIDEIRNSAINMSVNTGRHLRIRKLFPYQQKESYILQFNSYEMDFKLAPYIHFRNEVHLEDIKIYNKTLNRFENILDPNMYEVRFKDDKCKSRGFETQTKIIQSSIGNPGEGFTDGNVWGYNANYGVHIFGQVKANPIGEGNIISFKPVHCLNPPQEDLSIEFDIYQYDTQTRFQKAVVMIEFQTERIELFGDGYIHNVSNPLAPVPNEIKIIAQYDIQSPMEYDVIIDKTSEKWTFIYPEWTMLPVFSIDKNIPSDRLYIITDKGRFPLINPSTNRPSMISVETETGTEITFLNLYRRYEHIEVHSVPYPMRSVYVQRRIPQHGFIDLKGKINKPLNKKYFEFWVNGKLLFDEVTIITPSKIFLHGLTSLKNFEVIEINRDPNEYFSDLFLDVMSEDEREFPLWNYDTYLDATLEGNLDSDNYTLIEQESLLSPVWKQVTEDHPEFKNYPPNTDLDDDIIMRVNLDDIPIGMEDESSYQYLMIDTPTLEGVPISGRKMTFEQFGFIPISDERIIDILNEEWSDEISIDPYYPDHTIISDDEWYGNASRLYDEYGILVHTLDESAYHITDPNLLRINTSTKLNRIVKRNISYDLD